MLCNEKAVEIFPHNLDDWYGHWSRTSNIIWKTQIICLSFKGFGDIITVEDLFNPLINDYHSNEWTIYQKKKNFYRYYFTRILFLCENFGRWRMNDFFFFFFFSVSTCTFPLAICAKNNEIKMKNTPVLATCNECFDLIQSKSIDFSLTSHRMYRIINICR